MSALQPIPVSIFNKMADIHLRDLGMVVVEGEISQIQISQGKWLFMTIKDEKSSVGVFGAVFNLPGFDMLEEGMKVHVYGQAGLYQKTGRFNINATKILPAGEGALRQAYEKLKMKLESEGLFDESRKRKITRFPEKIGLITAPNSRAYGDFVKILQARVGGIQIFFYPINVQGDSSVQTILEAFSYFNQVSKLDAVVITRGGGSLEDLISFNDERVARAIFASKHPVISAIGHEDDVALTDYVADLRASTPSNAGELVSYSRTEILSKLSNLTYRLDQFITQKLWEWNQSIDFQLSVLDSFFSSQIDRHGKLLEKIFNNLLVIAEKTSFLEHKRALLAQRLIENINKNTEDLTLKLTTQERLLNNFDYKNTLKRGFSLAKTEEGKIISRAHQIVIGQKIEITFFDGKVKSKIL